MLGHSHLNNPSFLVRKLFAMDNLFLWLRASFMNSPL